MPDHVIIRSGSFRAYVSFQTLTQLPLKNWRRLCGLMWRAKSKNLEAINSLKLWFPNAVATAEEKAAENKAAAQYYKRLTKFQTIFIERDK